MPTLTIPCNFIGDFKVGDNLRYNCDILTKLADANEDGVLNKPIVLQVGAILEAALIQIIYRAQNFKIEGVPNIIEADRKKIEDSKVDKFSVAIDVLRKYGVINESADMVYDELHMLRRYRNKIHIQEDVRIAGKPRDERILFSSDLTTRSLSLNVSILQFLSRELSRPPHIHGYVGDLIVPI